MQWFNPREGGALLNGAVRTVKGGGKAALTASDQEDWLAIIRKN